MTYPLLASLAGAALVALGLGLWVYRAWADPGEVVPAGRREEGD